MKSGGGKQKGADYERQICGRLSMWVSAGKRRDCFWRSAMSGGRSTRAADLNPARPGKYARQAGDITATAPEGHALTDRYFIEVKFYRDLALEQFFMRQSGMLAGFWLRACAEAYKYVKDPILIAKQNHKPALFITRIGHLDIMSVGRDVIHAHLNHNLRCEVYLLDDVLKRKFKGRE